MDKLHRVAGRGADARGWIDVVVGQGEQVAHIVICIDEFADLLVAGFELEKYRQGRHFTQYQSQDRVNATKNSIRPIDRLRIYSKPTVPFSPDPFSLSF